MIKMWAQLTKKEQSFLLLFNNNVSNINLQSDILTSYLNSIQKHIIKETSSSENFIKNTLKHIEDMGFGKFDDANPILFRLNPLFSIFLKRQAKSLNKEGRLFIQSAYVNLYEGIAHTYTPNSSSDGTAKNQGGFNSLMVEFDNILQAFIISTSIEKVAIHCFFALEFLYCKFNNQDARFKLIQYLNKSIDEKGFSGLPLFQQKVLLSVYEYLGETYIDNTDYKRAINISDLGINIIKNTRIDKKFPDLIYSFYNNKAIAHLRLTEFDQALNLFEQIEIHYLKANHPKISSIHLNMGKAYNDIGKKDVAIKYYQTALKNCNSHSTLLSIYLNLGDTWRELGMIDFAERYYKKYFENLQDKYDYLSWGKGHHNLGMIATERKDFKEARKHYHSAIKFYLNSSKYHLARLFSDLGILETSAYNYEDSITYFYKSLANLDISQNKTFTCKIYVNLSASYFHLKNYDKVIEICEIGLKICKKIPYFESINYTRLAIVYAIKNKDSISQRYCQLALNKVHSLHQSQINFLIQNIEEFSKVSTTKNYILALKQYFVKASKSQRN